MTPGAPGLLERRSVAAIAMDAALPPLGGRATGLPAFGETYADEVAFAQASGWVVRRVEGHHLTHLTSPGDTARLLLSLCDELLG